MHTTLGGDSCVPGRGEPGSDRHSNDPGEKFLHSSSNFIQLNELNGSHGLSLFSGTTSEGGLPEKSDNSDAVLEFINHILMEEELDNNKINMSQDSLALQALEKSFYDAIGQRYPPSPYRPSLDSDVDILNPVSSITFQNSNTSLKGGAALVKSDDFNGVQADNQILTPSSESDFRSPCSGCDTVYGPCDSSICKCRRGLEEASQTHTSMKQALEKSFYDAIGQEHTPSPYKPSVDSDAHITDPVSSITCQSSITSLKGSSAVLNPDDFSCAQDENHMNTLCSESDFRSPCSGHTKIYGPSDSSNNMLPVSSLPCLCHSSVNKCKRCLGESSQTHTRNNRMINDLKSEVSLPPAPNKDTLKPINLIEKVETNYSSNGPRGKKNHQREDNDYTEEERDSKHSAVYLGKTELSDMFDKVLLSDEGSSKDEVSEKNGQRGHLSKCKSMSKRGQKKDNHNRERVDLTNLLTQCAQSIMSCDQKTASELLKQMRRHSSPFGDASERLVHCFAKGLEARLAGTKGQMYAGYLSYIVNARPASDMLKVVQVYSSVCPFLRAPFLLVSGTVSSLSRNETSLHIIDFGIQYGFQWPLLFQSLSKRPGGPPKVRITGIEVPSTGFRPSEGIEDTGRRLAHYCQRFNIPFEYFTIAKSWETIRLEDFNIDEDEFVVVNCMYRFEHLPDESVVASSPRSAVLELIRSINPNIFIHGIVNGNYNAPLFLRRFREALFHFSALFDMLEACLPRENETRSILETVIYGNDAINVIACEGRERYDRPETCKEWKLRLQRAGFRQMSLNQDVLKDIRTKIKLNYHKNFMVEENNDWMLLGWKGRTIHGLSCWK